MSKLPIPWPADAGDNPRAHTTLIKRPVPGRRLQYLERRRVPNARRNVLPTALPETLTALPVAFPETFTALYGALMTRRTRLRRLLLP